MESKSVMIRPYSGNDPVSGINFFVGHEVEHTPAFGLKTLFVTDVQSTYGIVAAIQSGVNTDDSKPINHIFFGANHSFNPTSADEWCEWEKMIRFFLDKDYVCSLDIPLAAVEHFNDCSLNEYNNFIPQIRIPIPYIKQWNYNAMLKIDDQTFNASNPGVWTHSLHDLQDRSKFTSWDEYNNDKIIK